MTAALRETSRRRKLQLDYNARHGVRPTTVISAKALQDRGDVETLLEQVRLVRLEEGRSVKQRGEFAQLSSGRADARLRKSAYPDVALESVSQSQLQTILEEAIKAEDFEEAALVRDHMGKL